MRHVDRPEEHWNGKALRAAKDLVELRLARDCMPKTRGGAFADEGVSVRLTTDFKRCSSATALPKRFAVAIDILIKLLLEIVHRFDGCYRVLLRFLSSAMVRDVGTSVV